ncbi:MAG: esterase-like activity of phytase family protein, partial [Microcystaceae cyanobacterium]
MQRLKQGFSPNQFLTIGLLSGLTIGLLNTQPTQASSLKLTFLGQAIFPTNTFYQGTQVGGLSGITYNPDLGVYYIISDDRSSINPARFYTATIDPTQFNANGVNSGVTFTGVTTLLQPDGQPFAAFSLDPEGIALLNDNSVYVSSEGEVSTNRIINPFVNQFGIANIANGQQSQALPIPSQFIPQPASIPTTSGVRNNLALESLTVTPDRRYLFTASENALVQDGPTATLTNGSPSRILQYDLATGQPIAQFLYNTDPVALSPNPANQFNTN